MLRGDPFLFGKSDFEIAVACGRCAQYATKLLRPNLVKNSIRAPRGAPRRPEAPKYRFENARS